MVPLFISLCGSFVVPDRWEKNREKVVNDHESQVVSPGGAHHTTFTSLAAQHRESIHLSVNQAKAEIITKKSSRVKWCGRRDVEKVEEKVGEEKGKTR